VAKAGGVKVSRYDAASIKPPPAGQPPVARLNTEGRVCSQLRIHGVDGDRDDWFRRRSGRAKDKLGPPPHRYSAGAQMDDMGGPNQELKGAPVRRNPFGLQPNTLLILEADAFDGERGEGIALKTCDPQTADCAKVKPIDQADDQGAARLGPRAEADPQPG
jgi:hypothetical protein